MRPCFLALAILITEATLQAQLCTENVLDGFNVEFQYGTGGPAAQTIGQTFTACATGAVTSITVHEGATSTFQDYSLWIAANPGAGVGNGFLTVNPVHEIVPNSGAAYPRTTTLALANPFPVTAGTVYRFVLDKPGGIIAIRCTSGTPPADYLGGEATDDFGTYTAFDLDFEVAIGFEATVSALPDPGGLNTDIQLAPPAVIGQPWSATAVVDASFHPPSGILVMVFSPSSVSPILVNLGAGVCSLWLNPGTLSQPCPPFQTYTSYTGTACAGVVIPNDLALVGAPWCTQVAVGTPANGFKLTNALCGQVGTY